MNKKWERYVFATVLAVCFMACMAMATPRPDNIGHRGTGSNGTFNPYPENTIPSFEQAILEGANFVELDVTLSEDGEVVVIHDDTLNRTTDCDGCVDEWTLEEIQACDAGEGTSMEGQGVIVPTLAEVFDAIDGSAGVNVEIKSGSCSGIPAAELAEAVDAVLQSYGDLPPIIISSFSLSILTEMEDLDPGHITAYLVTSGEIDEVVQTVIANGIDGIHPQGVGLLAEDIALAHSQGLFMNPWTINLEFRIRELVFAGVDGIVSDNPEVVASVLDEFVWGDDDDDDDTGDDDSGDDDTGDDDTSDDDTGDDDDETGDDDNDDAGDDDDDDDSCFG